MPPAPSTTARPDTAPVSGPSVAPMPTMSVLYAVRRPVSTRVLAAPIAAASASTSSATSSVTRLSGMVSDNPAHSGPRPSTNAGELGSAHS